ncbi:MAG TPA: ribosomal protein S18-alanine N-acetyltransferase [Candidatus Eisenbacteria bacterium]|nr:ribosomal protein S18-alanine N-acetyltransferase [Candidatus Eisenbacteria bacterium]
MSDTGPIRIVPITGDRLDEIVAIERRTFSDPWTRGMFLSELEVGGGTYARAALVPDKVEGERLVGYSFAVLVMDEAHLGNLAVDAGYRRRGIAQRLLGDLVTEARRQGVRRVTLEVRESNLHARTFYARNGFIDIAMRKSYYQNPVEDAIVMLLMLPGGERA